MKRAWGLWLLGLGLLVPRLGAADSVSLAGVWRFEIAPTNAAAYTRELSQQVRLPGTMDDAGLGPKNTKPPTLEGPYRLYDYAGPAWYQRDIEIPPTWKGQRVTLFLERCRWVTTVWLDNRCFGAQDSLIAPHVTNFGTGVSPGRHRLTICVDNTVKIHLGRFVSALFGGTWGNMNGIVGRIELAATPPVWLDDVAVYPNVQTMFARVKVRIGNASGRAGKGTLRIRGDASAKTEVAWDTQGGSADVNLDMQGAELWNEFSPHLQTITVRLGRAERTVHFGMRDFSTKGTRFALNGSPVYLRGTLECSIWPLTGYPPTDIESWRRIFRIEKSYGLNFIRFHSWCPPEAAFAAADQEGIFIQAEGPMANVSAGSDPKRDAFIEAEYRRIVDAYGNHPSFCLMSLGNEFGGNKTLLTGWVGMLEKRDSRHLYSSASNNRQRTENRQWSEETRGRGIHGPDTIRDLREVVASDSRPILGHEIGQWMYWPNFREIKKWTGVMALKNFELIRDDMAKKHLLDQEADFVHACGKFATLLYKEEIEVLLRTPGYGGFSLLDLHDYPTQGTALVGPLDAFWDSKGFITPKAFRRFCGSTVPLLRMPKRTYTADETFTATAEVAHFGPSALPKARSGWSLKDDRGADVARGTWSRQDVPTGQTTALGSIQASLKQVKAPCKLTVTVSVNGFTNDWNLWVYPARAKVNPPNNIVVCDRWREAKAALAKGKKVVYQAYGNAASPGSMHGRFLPVFWSPVWFPSQKPNTMGLLFDPKHPLFANFPCKGYSDWPWYGLMQHSRLFVLDDTPASYRPTLQVIDNFARNHKLGVMFEGRVGSGSLLVCGFDWASLSDDPAAKQLLAGLYRYVESDAFHPQHPLAPELLDTIFGAGLSASLMEQGARIRADSQAPGYAAEQAIDGDFSTMWHTPWANDAPSFPHELTVTFPKPVTISGITCLPRQDGNANGWIREYEVYAGKAGLNGGSPVARGAFPKDEKMKIVKFKRPVTTTCCAWSP